MVDIKPIHQINCVTGGDGSIGQKELIIARGGNFCFLNLNNFIAQIIFLVQKFSWSKIYWSSNVLTQNLSCRSLLTLVLLIFDNVQMYKTGNKV